MKLVDTRTKRYVAASVVDLMPPHIEEAYKAHLRRVATYMLDVYLRGQVARFANIVHQVKELRELSEHVHYQEHPHRGSW